MAGAWFVEVLGDGLTFRICPGAPLLLGRDHRCGIVLQDEEAGGRHASLRLDGDRVLLRPEPDWRPVTVNQEEVGRQETQLYLDDVVQVAGYDLRLVRSCDVTALCLAHEGGQVVHLARILACEGRYDELPVLADALEEAGHADAVMLAYCRRRRAA